MPRFEFSKDYAIMLVLIVYFKRLCHNVGSLCVVYATFFYFGGAYSISYLKCIEDFIDYTIYLVAASDI